MQIGHKCFDFNLLESGYRRILQWGSPLLMNGQ